ncbi:MAG TPA: HAMP domain-containing sensor histidine kinase, partial [Bacteroidota bacterium]
YSRLTRTIAFKLFLVICLVQTAVLGLLTFAIIQVQETSLMEHVMQNADQVSDMIARSTRYSMMLNRKEDVHEIIASVGGQPGIEGIRIYNKGGEVVFGTTQADLHTTVDKNAEACVICHTSTGLENPHWTSRKLSRIFANADGERVLGLITPIRNERHCADAACHAHPASKTILGVLDVKMSLSQVDTRLAESRNHLIWLSAGTVLLIGLISGGFIWLVIRRPVKQLIAGMDLVSTGHLDQRLEARSRDEIGQLAATFNKMTEELGRARAEITAWSQTLEAKVREKTADLEKAHRQMVRVEKMASLGNLASSVAHELNNPLEGILTFARLLSKRLRKTSLPPEDLLSYCEDLKLMGDEAQRCGNIVKNLLLFARQGGAAFQPVHVRTIVDRCALLVNHHAEMRGVRLVVGSSGDDSAECDGNQIQQVLIALMVNAVEAIAGSGMSGGVLTVSIEAAGPSLILRVIDNGPGMTDEVKAHIFEPFFTTKSEGKGVGLGLAIAYGIIDRHHGTIEVESAPGKGTTFTVTLPVKQPANAPARE